MKNFSRIHVEGMTLVFYTWVLKVNLFNSSASELAVAGLIYHKIKLTRGVFSSPLRGLFSEVNKFTLLHFLFPHVLSTHIDVHGLNG